MFALMALWVLFCNLAGAFDYTEPEGGSRVKYAAKTLSPVQVGQVVKALVLLAREKLSLKK